MVEDPQPAPLETSASSDRAALRALWQRIPYGVVLPDGRTVDIHVGRRAPLVDEAFALSASGAPSWALLTAWNPGAHPTTPSANGIAQAALQATIEARGLPWLVSSGGRGDDPTWEPEPGFVVGGLALVEAHALARHFGQAAFLYACRGAPVGLVDVQPPGFVAPRVIDTVAWIDRDERGWVRMVRPRDRALFFMPGGKKEAGEDDVTTLRRELREELAIMLDETTVVARFVVEERAHGPVEPTVVRMACYAGRARGEPVPTSEIVAQAFIAMDVDAGIPPAGRAVLARLRTLDAGPSHSAPTTAVR
jgi:8-oxo-dGTP diphosphatase